MTNTYTYWKSTLTGTVYAIAGDWVPAPGMGGWEPVHEETYLSYCAERGFAPYDLVVSF